MIGTIPADLTQFMGHSLRIVQKLAYLSGMPGFSSVDDMTDDEANMVLIYIYRGHVWRSERRFGFKSNS